MPTTSVPEGVTKYLLIDGQQRLTTIFILLSFLRDRAKENNDHELSEEITNTLLVNPYKKDSEYYKLLPTQIDRPSFQELVKDSRPSNQDLISKSYIFFRRKFQQQNDIDIRTLKKVISSNLSVVSIVLGKEDDPHLVFESLNAKGRPLTHSDLIRNYIFMRVHVEEQEDIHSKYWKPMQEILDENLTEYIRHYLTKDGALVKKSDVYFALKERIGDGDALEHLKEISRYSEYYKRILHPEEYESDETICKKLSRLNRIGISTAYPFLLNCYQDFELGRISFDEFLLVLSLLENFMIRRFICKVPTNKLNKIFTPLYTQIQNRISGSFSEELKKILRIKDYPTDSQFANSLQVSCLYGNADRNSKTKLILETIEEAYNHKEQVSFTELTIEHVMPQQLNDEWKQELGDKYEEIHELYLHVLGNLTLTGYNAELSNSPFKMKKQHLNDSHLEINKFFGERQSWTEIEIEWRSHMLAEKALKTWAYFGDDQVRQTDKIDVTGKNPDSIMVLGKISKVQSWSDVVVYTLDSIAAYEPEKLDKIVDKFPKFFDSNRIIRARRLDSGLSVEANFSANNAYRFCQQAVEEIGLGSEDWAIKFI